MEDFVSNLGRELFEKAAKKKGYSLMQDEFGRYEDNWLQEAWEIFSLIDFGSVTINPLQNKED